jgi:hypothetical protein
MTPLTLTTLAADHAVRRARNLTIIRLHFAIYFLRFRGRSGQKAASRGLCRIIRHLGSGIVSEPREARYGSLEIARVLVRLDHVARLVVNANHGIM